MFRRLLYALLLPAIMCTSAIAAEKITIAIDPTWPPLEFIDHNKNVVGYDVDLIKAVAREAGMETEVHSIGWDGIFVGIAAGSYDVVASGVSITPEREKAFLFTKPYYDIQQIVVLKKGVSARCFDDLKGKVVGAKIGSTGMFAAQKSGVAMKVRGYDLVGLAMQDLINGRIDAVICDSPVILYYVNKKEGFSDSLAIGFRTEFSEHLGFVVRKGRQDLVDRLNRGIDAVRAKGIEAELRRKWMGE